MKLRLFIPAIFLLVNTVAKSQCAEIKLALKQINTSELDNAILTLDSASLLIKDQGIENIDEKCLAKYYFGRGASYFEKAKKEGDLNSKISIFVKSEDAFVSFFKLNQQPEDIMKLAKSNIFSLAIEYINVGVDLYQKQEYTKALEYIEKGISLKKQYHPTTIENQDLFNAMVCAKMSAKYDVALTYADTLLNDKKITTDKKTDYLTQKVEILTALGKNDEALVILKKLQEENPTNANLKLTELQIYLNNKRNDEALILLNELCLQVVDREDLFIVKGQLHYQKNEFGQSISAFNTALQLNPKSESALYGLGVVHVYQANQMIDLMKVSANNIPENQKKLEGFYVTAAMYLDRLLLVNPNERDALSALISIYSSLDNQEKVKFYQDKLNAVK